MSLATTLKLFCQAYVLHKYHTPNARKTNDLHIFASARSGILHFTLHIWQNYLFVLVSLSDYRPCYIAIDHTLCHLHHLHQLAFMINGSIGFLPAWDYPHPPRRMSTPFLMLLQTVSLLIVTSLQHSALDHPWAPSHILHLIPYSLRDASWVSIAIWISTFWPTILLCSNFRGHMYILS